MSRVAKEEDQPSLTPQDVAKQMRVGRGKVMGWIYRGELAAINVASPGAKLPRYRITPKAVAELRETLKPVPTPTNRRRRKPKRPWKKFV